MKVLAIIPARGGSKGIPDKNIRIMNGKPLISYTIEVAKKSKLLTDIIVSSDSDKIIEVAKEYNCAFFKRKDKNAQDNSPIEPTISELIENLDTDYEVIMLLQPTAPIREAKDIDAVINMFIKSPDLENVVSVVELDDIHPGRMYRFIDDNTFIPLDKSLERKRRQELFPVYIRNGAIYAITTKAFKKYKKIILNEKSPYIMPENKWLNIDTQRDLIVGEALLKAWERGEL